MFYYTEQTVEIYCLIFELLKYYFNHQGYSLDVVIFEGYSPLNNRVIQWTCVILEVIHGWRRLEAKISRLFYVM